jgi:hypothetical protein
MTCTAGNLIHAAIAQVYHHRGALDADLFQQRSGLLVLRVTSRTSTPKMVRWSWSTFFKCLNHSMGVAEGPPAQRLPLALVGHRQRDPHALHLSHDELAGHTSISRASVG